MLHLAVALLRMFIKDRQAIFIGLLFPIIFLSALGFLRDRPPEGVEIGIVNHANSEAAASLQKILEDNALFEVSVDSEQVLRSRLEEGEATLVLIIPESFDDVASATELRVLVDAAQARLLDLILPTLRQALLEVEHTLRGSEPLFSLHIEDVQARTQRYLDFLLPGILAFTLMQISIAGSGFNLVEYRRKGVLKRLFVTPIRPAEFIASLCIARLVWCLLQLTMLLLFATWALDVQILGSYAALYLVIVLGTVLFLCLGFCVGSVAKTEAAVGAVGNLVIFPQMFLSGVFYPIEAMPDAIQPFANLLPLSYVSTSLREIASNGLALTDILPSLLGVLVWIAVSFGLATWLFDWKKVVTT